MKVYGVFERGNGCGGWHLLKAYATFDQADRHLGHERATVDEQEAAQNFRVEEIDVQES